MELESLPKSFVLRGDEAMFTALQELHPREIARVEGGEDTGKRIVAAGVIIYLIGDAFLCDRIEALGILVIAAGKFWPQ